MEEDCGEEGEAGILMSFREVACECVDGYDNDCYDEKHDIPGLAYGGCY